MFSHRPFNAAVAALSIATPAALATDPPLTCTRLASGLDRPLLVQHAPNDFSRIFVVEQTGKIRILNLTTGAFNATPFLNLASKISGTTSYTEYGVIGLVFDPDYANNGDFYVVYTPGTVSLAHWVLAKYHCNPATPDVADPASEQVILKITYDIREHRGGWMEFRDGLLYVTTGDGGEDDPDNAASNTSPVTGQAASQQYGLRGKVLRLDVHGGDDFPANPDRNYHIPATNPWASDPAHAGEIWAYGLRNPWRGSFDQATGNLYIGDVGQNAREEVDLITPSMTPPFFMGWRCKEGTATTTYSGCAGALPPSIAPILDYPHSGSANPGGFCVIGGLVYRGCAIPGLEGTYFFSDWLSTKIWSFRYDDATGTRSAITDRGAELAVAGLSPTPYITSFGTDAYGEIYWTRSTGATGNGELWKLVPRTLQGADCNANNKTDACEILADPSLDLDHDGVIDACEPCGPADLGHAGGLTGFDRLLDNNDFIAFINLFFAGDTRADQGTQGGLPGSDGQFDNNDFIAFINHFFAGCV